MSFFLSLGDESPLDSPAASLGSCFPPTTPTPESFPDFFPKEIISSPNFFPNSTNKDSHTRTKPNLFSHITRQAPTSSSTTGTGSDSSIVRSTKSNASIASSSSSSSSFSTSRPSGAVVPRPPRQVQKKQKTTSFGDRRGYGFSIDLAGSDKVFGNHSGRDVRF
ncbi:hypothetical protein E1B28_011464 [Marasmius oreades]|uniref:Uncharacterized protein n=1 Tax=Marasmius oreades TaxID=181124 RepID=A0A9P7RUW3_9AGAR|nr:uncharacterized protein E1B28_011464 [Marasmius oreades]KAG7089815.1 hypothetical protein E1B28_011464 [Marasmius oreades]